MKDTNYHTRSKYKRREFLYDPWLSTPTLTHQTIQLKAYFLWSEAGKPENKDQYFWYEAERTLRDDLGIISEK